ncbi:MAG TPA: hypothetical protein VFL57_04710 [Bryobacteraceae bacterium]|nr:hypothetical protein [Bryobacteraceae bacterium]
MRPLWVLMAAAAVPAAAPPTLARLSLNEQVPEVRRLFEEAPHTVTTTGELILQFHGKAHTRGCDDSSEWVFYFSRRDSRLVSVTRNLEAPVAVDTLIPRSAKPRLYRTSRGYPVLRAAMPDGREFVAAGARSIKDRVSQVQLIRTSDVARFYVDLRPVD